MSLFKDILGIAAPIVGGVFGGPLGAAAGQIIGGAVSGSSAQKRAQQAYGQAAQAATPTPWSVFSPLGNVISRNGQLSLGLGESPFYPMMQGLGMTSFANAMTAPGSAYYGASPELASAAQGFDPEALAGQAQERYNVLSQLAQPNEQRTFQQLEDQLFARGQMGTSGGGERYRAFYEAQNQADLQRQMQGQDWARSAALDRFNAALGAVGSGMQGQQQQAGIGFNSFGNFQNAMQALLQQGQLGVGAGAGVPGQIAMAQAGINAQNPWADAAQGAVGQFGPQLTDWLRGKWDQWRTPPFNPNAPDTRVTFPEVGSFF